MKPVTKVLMLLAVLLSVIGCNPDPNEAVVTITPQEITQTTALCGVYVTNGFTPDKIGVCWNLCPNPTVYTNWFKESTADFEEPFICELTDLRPGTEYFVRAYAKLGNERYYGEEKSFTTAAIQPYVKTLSVSDITYHSATCGGAVTYDGGQEVIEKGVCWSTSIEPTIDDASCVSGSDSEFEFAVEMTNLEANTTYFVRAYAVNSLGVGYGEQISFTTLGFFNGHTFVDLGLPSGTLWATCNMGADRPEEYGDYFSWAETQPKNNYIWSNYKYCNWDAPIFHNFTKYCHYSEDGYGGFTDSLMVLEPIDDAAIVNWGDGWCMPTKDQWWELRENTHSNWTTINGVDGRLFTASNGECLFLPFAGFYLSADGGEYENVGVSGSYWSCSLSPFSTRAWCFDVHYGHSMVEYDPGARADGRPIRPVRSSR